MYLELPLGLLLNMFLFFTQKCCTSAKRGMRPLVWGQPPSHHSSGNVPDARRSQTSGHFTRRQVEGTCPCAHSRHSQMESLRAQAASAGLVRSLCAWKTARARLGRRPPHAPRACHARPAAALCLLPWQRQNWNCSCRQTRCCLRETQQA